MLIKLTFVIVSCINKPFYHLQIVNGYFVHFFAPTKLHRVPKLVVFVIDNSYSMKGNKLAQVSRGVFQTSCDNNVLVILNIWFLDDRLRRQCWPFWVNFQKTTSLQSLYFQQTLSCGGRIWAKQHRKMWKMPRNLSKILKLLGVSANKIRDIITG